VRIKNTRAFKAFKSLFVVKKMANTLDLFNAKLLEFASELSAAFPDQSDLQTLKSGVALAVSLAPDRPQRMFQQYVVDPFESPILKRDEQFFLASDIAGGESEDAVGIIQRVQSVWKNMSPEDKNNVWKFFHVLTALSNKISANRSVARAKAV
jgi:hypothetical protein